MWYFFYISWIWIYIFLFRNTIRIWYSYSICIFCHYLKKKFKKRYSAWFVPIWSHFQRVQVAVRELSLKIMSGFLVSNNKYCWHVKPWIIQGGCIMSLWLCQNWQNSIRRSGLLWSFNIQIRICVEKRRSLLWYKLVLTPLKHVQFTRCTYLENKMTSFKLWTSK